MADDQTGRDHTPSRERSFTPGRKLRTVPAPLARTGSAPSMPTAPAEASLGDQAEAQDKKVSRRYSSQATATVIPTLGT